MVGLIETFFDTVRPQLTELPPHELIRLALLEAEALFVHQRRFPKMYFVFIDWNFHTPD